MDPSRHPFLGLPGPMGGRYDLPDLDEVAEAMEDEDTRQFLAAGDDPQPPATHAEIAATGIQPDLQEVVQSLRGEASEAKSRARKKVRVEADFGTAYKVGDNEPEEDRRRKHVSHYRNLNDVSQKIQDFWFEMSSNMQTSGLGSGVRVSKEEFHEAARPMVEAFATTSYQWKVKEYLDMFGTEPVPVSPAPQFKLFDSLCTCPELIIEVCKHLRPRDIIKLYSISRGFHDIVDGHMQSSVMTWARFQAPSSANIFPSSYYKDLYIKDPAGRPVDPAYYDMKHLSVPGQAPPEVVNTEVRMVPGLKWLDMVVTRHIRVRDILASLARMGHRLPPKMHITLKKTWLLMDIATNMDRAEMMKNEEIFTNLDIALLQFFVAKLLMAFNDPIYGPESASLMELMLGQRGLSPLWAMLRRKKYTTRKEIRRLKVEYDVEGSVEDIAYGRPYYGVNVLQMGRGHTEGWGMGDEHLMRPDEFLALESVRRHLDFGPEFDKILMYGHWDYTTGAAATPSLDEMYMSDDEEEVYDELESYREAGIVTDKVYPECGNVPFERSMWQPRDLLRKKWEDLSVEERIAIELEEQNEFSQTFDYKRRYYNLEFRLRHLETLWTVVSGSPTDTALHMPIDPMGKVNGVFDPAAFVRWGQPGILSTVLKQFPPGDAVLEPPAEWKMDEEVLLRNKKEYLNFLEEGESDPAVSDDDLLGWGDNPDEDSWDSDDGSTLWGDVLGRGDGGDEEVDDEDFWDSEEDEEEGEEGEEGEQIDESGNWEEDRDGDVDMADADDADDELEDDEIDFRNMTGPPGYHPINWPLPPDTDDADELEENEIGERPRTGPSIHRPPSVYQPINWPFPPYVDADGNVVEELEEDEIDEQPPADPSDYRPLSPDSEEEL